MRRLTWVWLAGCFAWLFDFAVNAFYHNVQHAELAFLMAVLFAIAYAFYRTQNR